MNLRDITCKELILTELKSEIRAEVLREMLNVVAARRGLNSPQVETYLAEILRRHDRSPSGLGRGLAFPNARLEEIERPALAIGLSRRGLDFESRDGKPAHVIFMYLGRSQPPPEERQMLTRLSTSLGGPDHAARFMAATTADDVWEAVLAMDRPEPVAAR